MTVAVTTATSGPFVPNGATTAFPFTFKVGSATELRVLIDGAEISSGLYTVNLSAGNNGGTVTFTTAPTGSALWITSDPDFAQQISFTNSGPFLPESADQANDRAAVRDIYLKEQVGRAIKLPLGSTPDELTSDVAGQYLAFDASGNPIGSSGTGTDAGLRTDLAAPSGAALVMTSNGETVDARFREKLSADRNYYVRTDGNDGQAGLSNSSASAFLTIQHAINTVYSRLDLNGFKAVIHVADGTYAEGLRLYGLPVGALDASDQPLQIIGNEATPANVIIAPPASLTFDLSHYSYVLAAGVTIKSAAGSGIQVGRGGVFEHRNCVFGPIQGEHILSLHNGIVRAIGPTTVTGNSQTFIHATKRSLVDFSSQPLTFSGSPVFSVYLYGINDATVDLDSATITGTATGPILVHDNAILNVSSLTGTWTGGTAPEVNDGGVIAIRDKLEARNFYVRTDGSDANDGYANTAARAFRTIQGAVDAISKMEFNPLAWSSGLGASITIVVGTGAYAETVNLRRLQYLSGTILGDETTPANVVINGVSYGIIASGIGTPWYVRGVKLTAAAGNCLHAERGSEIVYRNVEFGTATAHVGALKGGRLIADGAYKIVGAAAYHLFGRGNANLDISGQTITITGTPAFSGAFAYAEANSSIRAVASVFTGSATGVRYDVRTNGVIETNGGGATFIPGASAGSTATGGQYA